MKEKREEGEERKREEIVEDINRGVSSEGGGGEVDRHEGEDYDAGDEDYRNSIIQVGTNKYKNRAARVCTLHDLK